MLWRDRYALERRVLVEKSALIDASALAEWGAGEGHVPGRGLSYYWFNVGVVLACGSRVTAAV